MIAKMQVDVIKRTVLNAILHWQRAKVTPTFMMSEIADAMQQFS